MKPGVIVASTRERGERLREDLDIDAPIVTPRCPESRLRGCQVEPRVYVRGDDLEVLTAEVRDAVTVATSSWNRPVRYFVVQELHW